MYRVLIVEDDPMVAMINEQYIGRNNDFRVVGKFHDGVSALSFLKDNSVDLVVLDVYMPQMNGFEVLREIRSRNIGVDAIMVTAANDREALEEALHLGIVDYLIKPFTFERFQRALEKFIAQNHALQDVDRLNQNRIDRIIDSSRRKNTGSLPKGIQERTRQLILEQLRENRGIWLTGEELAEKSGLTGVTVRRYMNYLVEQGTVEGEMNYSTGGRPCMQYRICE